MIQLELVCLKIVIVGIKLRVCEENLRTQFPLWVELEFQSDATPAGMSG